MRVTKTWRFWSLLALGSGAALWAAACGETATSPAPSPTVDGITISPQQATLEVGEKLTLQAGIAAQGTVPVTSIYWTAQPGILLSVAPDRHSAEVTAQTPGVYHVTVGAGTKQAGVAITVQVFTGNSVLNGVWNLLSLELRPAGGGDPIPVPFTSGSISFDPAGSTHIEVSYPTNYAFDSAGKVIDYPRVRYTSQQVTFCQDLAGHFCGVAAYTISGSTLMLDGPLLEFAIPDSIATGYAEWSFER